MSIPPPDSFGQDHQPGFGGYGAGRQGGHPAAPLDDPLVPADLRGWAERVVGVARRSLVPLLTIQIGVGVVGVAISLAITPLLPEPGAEPGGAASLVAMLGLMVAVVIGIVAQSGSTYVAIRDAAGRPATASEGLRFAARLSPILIPWGLAAGALTMVGFVLIIPGLYLAVVFGATLIGVLTVERMPILRCFELVNRRFWPTVGRMLIALTVAGLYSVISSFVVNALSSPQSVAEVALQAAMAIPMGIGAVGVTTVTYAELRFIESPQVMTPQLAQQIELPGSP
ncbi:MAG TPA: hypothetical protein VL595_26370 [Pseudonocardia sp.]|nr:hypothetical protein [Pseudonocardia sp.]